MRKTVSAAAMAAALTVGGATGVALFAPEGVNAQTDPTAESAESTDQAKPERAAFLDETLAPLVEDGTIDQSQADAVIAAIEAGRPEGARGGHGGHGGHGGPAGLPGGGIVAESLGMTQDELRTAIADGQTIAAIAEANGVSLDDIKAALLAENDDRLAAAVEAGHLTQEEADAKKADAESRIDDLLNGTFEPGEQGGRGERDGRGPGHRGPGADGPDADESGADAEATDS